jgi:hypothetical protein
MEQEKNLKIPPFFLAGSETWSKILKTKRERREVAIVAILAEGGIGKSVTIKNVVFSLLLFYTVCGRKFVQLWVSFSIL